MKFLVLWGLPCCKGQWVHCRHQKRTAGTPRKDNKGKRQESTCKKMICIAISKKDTPKYEQWFGDFRIKEIQKINYVWIFIMRNENCDTEIWRHLGIAINAFEKLKKVMGKFHMKQRKVCLSSN